MPKSDGTRNFGGRFYLLGVRYHSMWLDGHLGEDDQKTVQSSVDGFKKTWDLVRVERRRAYKGAPFGTVSIWVFGDKMPPPDWS